MTISGYDCWKRKGLSRRRKLESVGAETTSSGSPFQIRGPDTLKARLYYINVYENMMMMTTTTTTMTMMMMMTVTGLVVSRSHVTAPLTLVIWRVTRSMFQQRRSSLSQEDIMTLCFFFWCLSELSCVGTDIVRQSAGGSECQNHVTEVCFSVENALRPQFSTESWSMS